MADFESKEYSFAGYVVISCFACHHKCVCTVPSAVLDEAVIAALSEVTTNQSSSG